MRVWRRTASLLAFPGAQAISTWPRPPGIRVAFRPKYTSGVRRTHKNREIEIKICVDDLPKLRLLLRRRGARRLKRVFESNTLYDSANGALFRSGRLLRLRLEVPVGAKCTRPPTLGGKGVVVRAILTFKGPAGRAGRYKVREEIEVPVPEPGRLPALLRAVGFRPRFRYEKFRTAFRFPGLRDLHIEVDETPAGVFLELEGRPQAIDRAARLLGRTPADYSIASYWDICRDWSKGMGVRPRNMLFPQEKK
jgi:adenylate cyclase class 2